MEQNGTIIMTVRRIASYLGATAGALALALAPSIANAAGPFNHIEVGGVAVTSTTFTGTGVAPINATIPGFGSITCSSLSAGGTVLPGTIKFTSLAVTCPSIIPGTTLVVAINSTSTQCTNGVVFTPTVGQTVDTMASATNPAGYAGPYDLATGSANFGNGTTDKCVTVTYKIGATTYCSYKLFGTVPWTFDETPLTTTPVSQRLNIAGNLTISSLSGACPGYTNGTQIALSVPLNITTPIASGATNPGLIDFAP